MGRKTDALLRGFRAARCLTLLKLTTARIKLIRNKKSITTKQMRKEIAQLLKSGQDAHVYITKADTLIREENMVAAYDLIDQFCHSIISRFPIIETQRNCPIDMKEPITSLIFAAPRCAELGELINIKDMFTSKYGKEFAAAAAELRPECGVNTQIIEKLSTRPASGQMKLKLMKEICVENNIEWTPGDALTEPPKDLLAGSSQSVEAKVDVVRVAVDERSTKSQLAEATSSRISEAGSSNVDLDAKAHSQRGSRHGGSSSFGPAATAGSLKTGDDTMSATDEGTRFQLSPSSSSGFGTKHGSFSGDDVARVNVRVSESFQGVTNEGASSSNAGFSGSLKAEAPKERVEYRLQPVVDVQDGMSDSGSDESYVSAEEERVASRRESLTKNSFKGIAEVSVNGSSLREESLRESSSSTESSHEGNSLRENRENSLNMKELSEEKSFRASRENSLNMKELSEEKSFRANTRENNLSNKLAKEQSFRASRENSLSKKKPAEASEENSLHRKELSGEKSFRASEENSLHRKELSGEKSFRASRENSLNMKKLAEEKSFRASEMKMTPSEGTSEEMNSLPIPEMQKLVSSSTIMCVEQTPFHKKNSLNLKKPSESASEEPSSVNSVPALEKTVQEVFSSSSRIPVTPEYDQDFATTAKAIAAEAARLAVLDYARQYARSGSITMELGDLPSFGLAFGENMNAKQAENLINKGKQATSGSQRHGDEDDRWDVTKEKSKNSLKTTIVDDGDDDGNMDGMGYTWDWTKENSKQSAVVDDNDDSMGYRWDVTKDEEEQPSKTAAADADINPFAAKIVAGDDEEINLFSVKTGGDEGVSMLNPGSVKKSGGTVEQEEEELDPFFMKQTHRRHAEKPMFDEGRHSFVKMKASFDEKNVPSYGYGKHESNLQDMVAGMPIFDQVSYKESLFSEEGSKAYKSPVFDEGFTSYKSRVYNEGPESSKIPFSFDDGLDKSMFSGGLSDQKPGHQSSAKFKAPASSYFEPEPHFDEVAEEEEQPSMNQMTSQHMDQMSWNSKKSTKAQHVDHYHDERVTTGETWDYLSSTSDASAGDAGHVMSRSRREPQRMDEYDYDSDKVVGAKSVAFGGSSNQVMSKRSTRSPTRLAQHHQKEQEENNEDYAGEVKWETRPAESSAYSGHAMSKRPLKSPKWDSQQEQDLLEGDATSTTSAPAGGRFMSKRTTKSPTRLVQRQQVTLESDEVQDNAEGKNWDATSAGSRSRIMSKRTTRSPTRLAQTLEENDEAHAEGGKWEATPAGGHTMRSTRSPIQWAQQEQVVLKQGEVLSKEKRLEKAKWDATSPATLVSGSHTTSRRSSTSPRRQQVALEEDYPEAVTGGKWNNPSGMSTEALVDSGHAMSKRSSWSHKLVQQQLEDENTAEEVIGGKWQASLTTTATALGGSGQVTMKMQPTQQHKHKVEKLQSSERYSSELRGTEYGYASSLMAQTEAQEPASGYKPLVQADDVGERIPSSPLSGQQQQHRQEKQTPSSGYKPFVQVDDLGKRTPSSQLSGRQQKQHPQEEHDLASGYKPLVQADEEHDLGKRIPSSSLYGRQQQQQRQEKQTPLSGYKPFVQVDDLGKRILSSQLSGRQQQLHPQEEQDMASGYKPFVQVDDLVGRTPSSQLSSRQQQQRSQEEQDLASGYKPFVQVDDLGRRTPSSPLSGWQQQQRPEERQHPLPDRQQEQHQVEQQRLSSPESGRQQELRLEKERPQSGWQEEHRQGEQQQSWLSLSGRRQKILSEEEAATASSPQRPPAKLDTKAQMPARPPPRLPPQSTSPPLTSSASDPIILATIPPPPKKPLTPPVAATKLATSISAPPSSTTSDPIILATIPPPPKKPLTPPLAATKLATSISAPPASTTSSPAASTATSATKATTPQKPPPVDVLAARFEALLRAKRGEGPPS